MSKQFYFKQFILKLLRSLNAKTVLFQTILFSMGTVFIYTQLNVKQFYFEQFDSS